MGASLTWAAGPARARALFPGVLACGVVAAAATFLGEHYGAPVLLFALLLGLAMNFLADEAGPCAPGIEWCARSVLRLGVALLGLRITLEQVVAATPTKDLDAVWGKGFFPPNAFVGLVYSTLP